MTSSTNDQDPVEQEGAPDKADLEEPSTEKEPGQEPKSDDAGEPEPSHEAVGIGVIGAPLVDPEPNSDGD